MEEESKPIQLDFSKLSKFNPEKTYQLAYESIVADGRFNVLGGFLMPTHQDKLRKKMKSSQPLKITKQHRIQIYNLAVKQIKSLQASTFLINQDKNIGASANSEQIRKSLEIFYQNDLKANPQCKIESIILTGVDNLSLFQRKIKRGEVIAIVENRPNQTSLSLKKWLKSPKVKGHQQNLIAVFDTKAPFQISSTQLRRMFHTSKSQSDLEEVKKYFQPAVFEYHIQHKLVYPVSQQAKDVYTFDVKQILAGIKFNEIDYKSLYPLQQNSENNDEEIKLNADFSKGQLLGQGLSAKVRLMNLKSVGKQVAVKLFLMNNSRGKKISIFKREMEAFGAINGHSNIIYCYGAGQKQQQYLFIVLQVGINVNSLKFCQQLYFCQCKSNYKSYLRKILPGIVQLSKALQYMSEKGVLHRDLQSDNIIAFKKDSKLEDEESKLTNYTFKILDFGVSAFEGSEDAGARGSLKYYSPEAAEDKINYTTKSDVFSFGLLVYEFLMLQVIWKEIKRVGPILQRHAKGIRPQFGSKQIPDEIKKLVEMTWKDKAEDRIQFGEFAKRLQEIMVDQL